MGPAADASLGDLPNGHAHILLQICILVLQGHTCNDEAVAAAAQDNLSAGVNLLTGFLTSHASGQTLE